MLFVDWFVSQKEIYGHVVSVVGHKFTSNGPMIFFVVDGPLLFTNIFCLVTSIPSLSNQKCIFVSWTILFFRTKQTQI